MTYTFKSFKQTEIILQVSLLKIMILNNLILRFFVILLGFVKEGVWEPKDSRGGIVKMYSFNVTL